MTGPGASDIIPTMKPLAVLLAALASGCATHYVCFPRSTCQRALLDAQLLGYSGCVDAMVKAIGEVHRDHEMKCK